MPNSPEQWYSQMLIITKILNVSQNAAEGWLGVLISSHSAPEQWPSEKKTSTPKINPNESVLQLYIDI